MNLRSKLSSKSIFIAIVFFISLTQTLNAQKVFATKSGQIYFNATGALVKIAAVNNQVDSKFVDATGQIIFGVLIKGFKFENQLMEDHFNENYMESTQFPKADFKGYITNIKEINFLKDGAYPIQVEGTLTIHGVAQKITTKGTLTLAQGKPTIVGEFNVKIKDYGISGMYIGDKIANQAIIKLNCKY
ncbi:MAG: YceI family protein [Sediminibacterium sp.]|jgi:hypothetical protein|nr:YceI family protein [Sediminibacterium sp.]